MAAIGIYARELRRLRAEFAQGKIDVFTKKTFKTERARFSHFTKQYGKKGATGPVVVVTQLPKIQVPEILLKRQRFMSRFSQALATAVKYRVSVLGIGEFGGKTLRANNTGGMWRGLISKSKIEQTSIAFAKSSYPSSTGKKLARAGGLEGLSRRKKSALRKKLALKKIDNRLKARTVQKHIRTDLLAPSQTEINATLEWFKQVFDSSLMGK